MFKQLLVIGSVVATGLIALILTGVGFGAAFRLISSADTFNVAVGVAFGALVLALASATIGVLTLEIVRLTRKLVPQKESK